MFLAAGVVAYHPDDIILSRLIGELSDTARAILVFCNSPLGKEQMARVEAALAPGVTLTFIGSGHNEGLGRAHNSLVRTARRLGASHLMLLDQDSFIPAATVRKLVDATEHLQTAGQRAAVIGPRPVQPASGESTYKSVRLFLRGEAADGIAAADFVISSGALIDLAAAIEIGAFRDDFFIDALDIEWCFRAWEKGYSCWIAVDAPMEHRLGAGSIVLPLLHLAFPIQPPRRLYTYARNQMTMLFLRHIPMRWKVKIVPYIALQVAFYLLAGRRNPGAFSALVRGVRDGLRLACRRIPRKPAEFPMAPIGAPALARKGD